ncbi:MAG: hypothetical protein OXG87_01505 [Gemmatimonadetes bacterium]|nr:hypothetical protein [Gemmatimonadota bacterium]
METIRLSNEILEKLGKLCQAGGYKTIAQGLEHAIDHHLLELRRQRAEKRGKKVRKKLQEKNLTEDEILKDFEIFRENLRQGNAAT